MTRAAWTVTVLHLRWRQIAAAVAGPAVAVAMAAALAPPRTAEIAGLAVMMLAIPVAAAAEDPIGDLARSTPVRRRGRLMGRATVAFGVSAVAAGLAAICATMGGGHFDVEVPRGWLCLAAVALGAAATAQGMRWPMPSLAVGAIATVATLTAQGLPGSDAIASRMIWPVPLVITIAVCSVCVVAATRDPGGSF